MVTYPGYHVRLSKFSFIRAPHDLRREAKYIYDKMGEIRLF